jgi:hypothetical protein
MSNFNSLYIFAKGYAQLSNGDQLVTKNNSDLSSVQPLIDNIKSLRPDGVSEGDYHVIRIFKGVRSQYISSTDGCSYNMPYDSIDGTLLTLFVNEITS